MPQNPKPNQDNQTSQTTNNPDSWAAPKGTAEQGFVRLNSDDLHPERVERLGQYLSDTSTGTVTSNLDVTGGLDSHYPISPPGETTPAHFQNQVDAVLGEATMYFNELSRGHSFDPGIGEAQDGTYGPGHELLSSDAARNIVSEHIDTNATNRSSRWYGIGQQRFDPNVHNNQRYQVNRTGDNLDANVGSQAEYDGAGSRYKDYRHKTGQLNAVSMSDDGFWDDYFERLGLVGAKITLGATGHDVPPGEDVLAAGGSLKTGNPTFSETDLGGNYQKIELENTIPGNTFFDGPTPKRFGGLKSQLNMEKSVEYTSKSYGQMHSWLDPFDQAGFALSENRGKEVAGQLLEIYAMSVLKTLTTTSLLQIASYLVSVVMQNLDWDGDGLEDYLGVNWNANYYPESPLMQPGTAFFKGYSGFNHPSTNLGHRAADALNRGVATIKNDVGGFFATVAYQQVGPPLSDGLRLLDNELLNFTTNVLRELNIYMPRHTISQLAQEISYHDDHRLGIKILKVIAKLADIATAYGRAMTVGFTTMAVHIIGGDSGRSLGFYRTLFREVVRSKAVWNEQFKPSNNYDELLSNLGKDDKIMRFTNYLVQIGDMSIGAGDAGNIAFPENKVPLHQVGNHPSLRTIAGRMRGMKEKSRLSLTDTPSLFLLPRTKDITASNLQRYGLEDAYSMKDYANLSGKNRMYVGDKDAHKGIKQKFQKKEWNRFLPEQVQRIEDQLEAEHMPFYIQDLRTNEIISFHAFLTSISDSYSAEWSAQKGFGRMEAAQIYGGGSRSIAVNFMIVPMNKEDFDEMYYKINKLTTLVYPQWSRGTWMENNGSTFVQPFSQVPTASPLCRIRVGDLFTSNYSDVAMARMMGIDDKKFKYIEPSATDSGEPPPEEGEDLSIEEQIAQDRRPSREMIELVLFRNGIFGNQKAEIVKDFNTRPNEYTAVKDPEKKRVDVIFPPEVPIIPGSVNTIGKKTDDYFLQQTIVKPPAEPPSIPNPLAGGSEEPSGGLASIFDRTKNPIMKSFNSTMGRGIAVAITSIGLDWKLNSVPWNLEPGHKAPRMCEVSLSLVPIHDITPGLDSQGINRAPIYKVGKMSKSLTGDVWHNKTEYNKLTSEIAHDRDAYLRAEEDRKEED